MDSKEIIDKYYQMVYSIANSLSKEYAEDLIAVGNSALLKAVGTFDNTRKVKFMTYAFKNIKNSMRRELKRLIMFKSFKKDSEVLHFSEIKEVDLQCDIEELILGREKSGTLKEAINLLDSPYKETIVMIYWNGLSLVETGKFLGVGPSRVAQIHKAALEKLKKTIGEKNDKG